MAPPMYWRNSGERVRFSPDRGVNSGVQGYREYLARRADVPVVIDHYTIVFWVSFFPSPEVAMRRYVEDCERFAVKPKAREEVLKDIEICREKVAELKAKLESKKTGRRWAQSIDTGEFWWWG